MLTLRENKNGITNFLSAKTRSLWLCCISDVSEVRHVFTPRDKEIFGNNKEMYGNYETKQMYDSIATVGEIRVYWRADFQSGSRVLKKVF